MKSRFMGGLPLVTLCWLPPCDFYLQGSVPVSHKSSKHSTTNRSTNHSNLLQRCQPLQAKKLTLPKIPPQTSHPTRLSSTLPCPLPLHDTTQTLNNKKHLQNAKNEPENNLKPDIFALLVSQSPSVTALNSHDMILCRSRSVLTLHC